MRDWHATGTNADGKLTEAAKDQIENKADEIIAEAPHDKFEIKGPLTQHYKAGTESCRAMDEVFQATP